MDETELRLDGNALAGLLEDVFGVDVTAAAGRCASCGHIAEVGAQHLYRYPHAPGAVLRCSACENLLLVLVERPDGCHVTLRGLSWLEVEPLDS